MDFLIPEFQVITLIEPIIRNVKSTFLDHDNCANH